MHTTYVFVYCTFKYYDMQYIESPNCIFFILRSPVGLLRASD